jgi:hypothetical protein
MYGVSKTGPRNKARDPMVVKSTFIDCIANGRSWLASIT